MARVVECVRKDEVIRYPRKADLGDYAGSVSDFQYVFEGEDDLLHLMVIRVDGGELLVESAQAVASFLMPKMLTSMMWLKPGIFSQHFYFGHDELLTLY